MVRRLLTIILLALLLAAGLGWAKYQQFLSASLALPPEGVVWEAPTGASFRAMVADLAQRGYTERGWQWRVLGYLDPRTERLKAGEYRLPVGLTPSGLLDLLVSGDVLLHRFTIVEGWSQAQMRQALAEHPAVKQTLGEVSDSELMAKLGSEMEHPEGWFLPETYRFPRGTTDVSVLRRAHDAMRTALAKVWDERREDLPYDDPYEVLIMASIIEKETAVAAERTQIAGVFVRRLQRGMRLQTDPTVIYGMGPAYNGDIRWRDLRTDTPYNTYTRAGLPPTPIALPGIDALKAAVAPADEDSLYFVSRGDGSHHFSATLEEHNRAVDRYQRGRQ